MLGHHRHASETLSKWRFAGGLKMSANSGIWILPTLIKLETKKSNVVKIGTTLGKLSRSAQVMHGDAQSLLAYVIRTCTCTRLFHCFTVDNFNLVTTGADFYQTYALVCRGPYVYPPNKA